MAIVYQDGVAGEACANTERGWKPLSEFAPRRFPGIPVGDGYKSRCKECVRVQARSECAAKLEDHQAGEREHVENNTADHQELKRKHQNSNPEKYQEAQRKYREIHREELNAKAGERNAYHRE